MPRMEDVTVKTGGSGREPALEALFRASFAASEGEAEGALIGGLVRDLLTDTEAADLRVFRAEEDGALVGAVVFTRLAYPDDPHAVVLLSPMAVATERQGRGIGQALLTHALGALREEGFDVALTYGDPAFYGKVGFRPVAEDAARAPLRLSLPHGWLGQALSGRPMPRLRGASRCVSALNRAELW